jgi:hypothetical protein
MRFSSVNSVGTQTQFSLDGPAFPFLALLYVKVRGPQRCASAQVSVSGYFSGLPDTQALLSRKGGGAVRVRSCRRPCL